MISIVITTYCRSHIIQRSLYSAGEQSYKNIEILIIDDNGLDSPEQISTYQKVEEFKNQNVNIKIDYYPLLRNSGANFARNFGANIAKGDFLAFFDDDDVWHIDKLNFQLAVMEFNSKLSFCYTSQLLKKRKMILNFYIGSPRLKIYSRNFIGGTSNPLIRKECFWEVNGFDESFKSCQDWDLWVRLLKVGEAEKIYKNLVTISNDLPRRISTNFKDGVLGHWIFFKKYWRCILINPVGAAIFLLKFSKRFFLYIMKSHFT